MNILVEENIAYSYNTVLKTTELNHEKDINLNENIYYLSTCDNFIYCKKMSDKPEPLHEITIRINIDNPLEPYVDYKFEKSMGIASHNMYVFKDKNNKTNSIGGQHCSISSFEKYNSNNGFNEYHNHYDNILIDSINFNINFKGCEKIFDHTKICPYYANGLHLFDLNGEYFEVQNNKLPIISGVHDSRYDGYYGNVIVNNLESCKDGLAVL